MVPVLRVAPKWVTPTSRDWKALSCSHKGVTLTNIIVEMILVLWVTPKIELLQLTLLKSLECSELPPDGITIALYW